MKCPKCLYLGFETGDRCKNCGYDFSLIEFHEPAERDVDSIQHQTPERPLPEGWDRYDARPALSMDVDAPLDLDTRSRVEPPVRVDVPARVEPPASSGDSAAPLPLFALTADDQPLVRLPATPRRPLAVRRTPENPRLRSAPRAAPASPPPFEDEEPALQFADEPRVPATVGELLQSTAKTLPAQGMTPVPAQRGALVSTAPSRRLTAAVIDYGLLLVIDIAIVYFTVRMAGLDLSEWRVLPLVPLGLFLLVIALAYVGVFTAIGGQTIGKMATGIKVVSDDPDASSAVPALMRTGAVVLSWLTVGVGFLPVLVGDHRALHDRLSHTRVVDLA